jgi:DNA-binding NarL/FixJ family response regulator
MEWRVLLLCSDAGTSDLLRKVLAHQDMVSDHVSSLEEALALVVERRYDALVLDAQDEQGASAVISKAHLSKVNSGTLVIALVGSTNDVRHLFSLGTNFVLYKPISEERAKVSLKAAQGLMRRERRRVPRIPVYTPANLAYANVEESKSTMLDVSEEGAAIQSERRLPPACKVYFQFTLPGQTQLVRLSGEVAWQDSTGRVGIRFVAVPQASRRILNEWLLHNNFRKENSAPKSISPAQATPTTAADAEQSAVQRLRSLPGNRRGESRHACSLGAEVYRLGSTVPNRCTLSDISGGGCYVEMPTPFEANSPVEIIVRTQSMKIRVRGMVQATHPGFGMGVRFSLKDAPEREQVQQLINVVSAGPTLEPTF